MLPGAEGRGDRVSSSLRATANGSRECAPDDRLCNPENSTVAKLLPRISLQPRRLDAGDRADLVIIRGIAGDADRAEQCTVFLDQDAAGHRHQLSFRHRINGADEVSLLLRALDQRPRTHAEGECAI